MTYVIAVIVSVFLAWLYKCYQKFSVNSKVIFYSVFCEMLLCDYGKKIKVESAFQYFLNKLEEMGPRDFLKSDDPILYKGFLMEVLGESYDEELLTKIAVEKTLIGRKREYGEKAHCLSKENYTFFLQSRIIKR